jgi:hypothetical protein
MNRIRRTLKFGLFRSGGSEETLRWRAMMQCATFIDLETL